MLQPPKGRVDVKRFKWLSAERLLPAACCLLAVAALIYAAATREPPAETEVTLSSQVTLATLQSGADSSADTTTAKPLCRDLNAATKEDLMRVEGIGQVLAQRIITDRTRKGGFCRRAELTDIDGVGESLMQRIMEEFFIPDELPPETEITQTTTKRPAATETTLTVTAGRYDLNLVTEEELLLIPGMTKQLAEGILELRTAIQYYTHLYEVLYVDGMNGSYVDDVLAEHLYVTPREQTSVHP